MEWTKLDITKASVVRSEVDKVVALLGKNNAESKDILGKNLLSLLGYLYVLLLTHSLTHQ
jgi:hypothetical protein